MVEPTGNSSDNSMQSTPVEIDDLAERFMDDRRNGLDPSVEEYAQRYPELASQIQGLFPTILGMEKLRHGKISKRNDGAVELGPRKIRQLGDFTIIHEIGRGGMGVVYECQQQSLDRRVAIKVLPDNVLDAESLDNFLREAQLAAKLHHTNIVPIYGVGSQDGFNFYVMQLIHGISLENYILQSADTGRDFPSQLTQQPGAAQAEPTEAEPTTKPEFRRRQNKKFTAREVAQIGCQVADALQYAHDQGTLHRDIKPANLLLDREKNVWMTDFGLAIHEQSTESSQDDSLSGTLRYMAPERMRGHYDRRSELYSLGITLFEIATGKPAFAATSKQDLAQQIQTGALAVLSQPAGSQIPIDLEAVLRRATALEPENRYESALQMREDLDRFLAGRPVIARRYSAVEKLLRWSRRRPALAMMTATVAMLLVAITLITSIGNWKLNRSFELAVTEKIRAQRASDLANDVVDRIFFRFNPNSSFSDSIEQAPQLVQPILSREAAAMLNDLLQFYQKLAENNDRDPVMSAKTALAAGKVGEIYERLGDYDQAIAAFEASLTNMRHLPPQEFARRQLQFAKLYNHIGNAYVRKQEHTESRAAFQTAVDLLESHPQSAIPEVRLELARSLFNMDLKIRPGMGPASLPPPESIRWDNESRSPEYPEPIETEGLSRAIEILRDLISKSDVRSAIETQASLLLAKALRELAKDELQKREDSDYEAENESIRILKRLVADAANSNLSFKYELMTTLAEVRVFQTDITWEQLPVVKSNLDEALKLATELIRKRPDIVEYQLGFIHTNHKLAMINYSQADGAPGRFRRKNFDQAIQYNQECITAQRRLCAINKRPGYTAWLAKFLLTQAELEFRTRRPDKGLECMDEARELLSTIPEPFASEAVINQMVRRIQQLERQRRDLRPPPEGPLFDGPGQPPGQPLGPRRPPRRAG